MHLTSSHTDAVKTLRHVHETNSLVAVIGISVVATGLAGLAVAYWVPTATGWHWSMIIPASFVLGMGPIGWCCANAAMHLARNVPASINRTSA